MKFFPWRTGEDVKFDGDDVNESIIDALNRKSVPYGGDYQTTGTVPMAYVPPRPNPPSRHARPELHITPPQGMNTPPSKRPSRGRVLKAARATLPVFHATTHVLGWRAFILPGRPCMSTAAAVKAINVYTERTVRVICQQTEAAKGELWERARDFDQREAELRRPLNMQTGM